MNEIMNESISKWLQVVKTQMDQEAEIMKQSMARQEAAQQAAPQEDDEQAGPLRTASSGARGLCLKHLRV